MLKKRARSNGPAKKKAKTTYPRIKLGVPSVIKGIRMAKTKLTYCDAVTLNPGAGTAANHLFAVNGLFDPDITGAGHQPAGYDQYMALFNVYVVTAAHIKVTYYNTSTTLGQLVSLSYSDLPTVDPDIRRYIEQGNSRWAVLGTESAGNGIQTLSLSCNMREVSGQDIFNSSEYEAGAATNPSDTHYFVLSAAALDFVSDPSSVRCAVEIQYEVYFRDPATTALS